MQSSFGLAMHVSKSAVPHALLVNQHLTILIIKRAHILSMWLNGLLLMALR
ncbi:hypothetical protein PPAR_a2096 [Pseudoalteromonas paragorgicola KMM 3548]|nr:hypothetical protein [Pseudoalteromonas distincta KMM 3548]